MTGVAGRGREIPLFDARLVVNALLPLRVDIGRQLVAGHQGLIAVATIAGLGDLTRGDRRAGILHRVDSVRAVTAHTLRYAFVYLRQLLAVAARQVLRDLIDPKRRVELL